jgi:hypothetical protein
MGEDMPETIEDKIASLRCELLIYGFAAVKQIAEWRQMQSGTIECPLCQGELRFSISPSNGHMHAACKTEGCIKAME